MSQQVEADKERLKFLCRLDLSDSVSVTDWEASFIESHIGEAHVDFSPKQREAIDRMIEKYGARIGWE